METGIVYIVGAGPGDPDLLTIKATECIREADVILHDSLVGTRIIERLPDDAQIVNVGKRPAGERTSQDEINRIMVSEAMAGNVVVRLKGGDPSVFGRVGEEVEFLTAKEIPVKVIPGISSVLAAPAVANIPLTHRDHASSVTIITGHEDPSKPESALDWGALTQTVVAGGTLVVLMGVKRLPEIVSEILTRGGPSEMPVGVIEKATLPGEFVVLSTLEEIVDEPVAASVEPPAITVIGEVVRVGEAITECLGNVPSTQILHQHSALIEHRVNHR